MAKNGAASGAGKAQGARLRTIIFLSMFAASAIPLGASSYWNYQGAKADLAAAADANLKAQGKASAELLTAWVDSNIDALKFMALTDEAVSMDKDKGATYVKAMQKSAPWFYAFFMIDTQGMQIAKSDDKLNNVSDRLYFKQAMAGAPWYQISISKTTNKPAFLPAVPIIGADRQIVGVFAGGADMDGIGGKITGHKIGKTGYSYLVSDNNTILAHPDVKKIGVAADDDVKRLDPASESVSYAGGEGEHEVRRVASAVGNGFKLVSQIDEAEVEGPLADIQASAWKFIGLATGVSLLLAFLLSSAISRAIIRLSELSDQLSMAQSGSEIDAITKEVEQVGGPREVRALGSSLSRLAQSIKLALSALS